MCQLLRFLPAHTPFRPRREASCAFVGDAGSELGKSIAEAPESGGEYVQVTVPIIRLVNERGSQMQDRFQVVQLWAGWLAEVTNKQRWKDPGWGPPLRAARL